MKKFLYTILAAAAVAFSASSCTEDGFLKEEMVATITQQYYESETGMDALVTGMYDYMRYMFHNQDRASSMWESLNDTGATGTFTASSYSATGSSNLGTLMMLYQGSPYYQRWGIYPCYNDALNIIDIIDNKAATLGGKYLDAAYCAKQKSVAMFAKDWMLYQLAAQEGDVYIPQQRTTKDTGVYYAPRSTSEELYKMFISDMEYAYKNLPSTSSFSGSERNERITKGAAAFFLAHVYFDIAVGEKFKSMRNTDGSYKQEKTDALGMLYKGEITSYKNAAGAVVNGTALDACIHWAGNVIGMGDYALENDFNTHCENISGNYEDENSREIVWAMAASHAFEGESNNNGAWGWRLSCYYGRYTNAQWGLPNKIWTYGSHYGKTGVSDWGIDVFTDKMSDSRYSKTFYLDLYPLLQDGTKDKDYYSDIDPNNAAATWLANQNPFDKNDSSKDDRYIDWFNANKATFFGANSPYKNRLTAVAKAADADYSTTTNKKISGGEVSIVMIANDREHAIDADLCHSMPFIVAPRWSYYENPANPAEKRYYYGQYSYTSMAGNPGHGIHGTVASGRPFIKKYIDPDRLTTKTETASRNVTVFRLSDMYLLRAWAKGLKGDYPGAIDDINVIRQRAGYNAGEKRPMAIAQFADYYPDGTALTDAEKEYPYTVAASTKDAMKIDATYWTPGNANFEAERYPHYLSTPINDRDGKSLNVTDMNGGFTDATQFYFSNFILNEYCRELLGEPVMLNIQQMAGLRYPRLMWHSQRASTLDVDENGNNIWPEAMENSDGKSKMNGHSQGFIQPHMIWQPITIGFLDNLTDENGKPLDDAGRDAYQNPGYVD